MMLHDLAGSAASFDVLPESSPASVRLLLDQNPVVGTRPHGRGYFWTAPEVAVLRQTYPVGGLAACLPLLPGRSASTIYQKAGTLGLRAAKPSGGPRKVREALPATPQLDEAIRRVWLDGPTNEGLRGLVRLTGRPRRWFICRAQVLGLAHGSFRSPPWSAAELEVLRARGNQHPVTIRQALGRIGSKRTVTGIVSKLKRLGWEREAAEDGYSQATLAEVFGVGRDRVAGWAARGLLEVRRKTPMTVARETHGKAEWTVGREALRQFVIDNVAVIDFRLVDKFWLVELLAEKVTVRKEAARQLVAETLAARAAKKAAKAGRKAAS
jgi:hypothetical protein